LWEKQEVELLSAKTVLIVGFGDIGAACGKILKHGFGAKVIGLKRRPETISERNMDNADMVIGLDKLEEFLP